MRRRHQEGFLTTTQWVTVLYGEGVQPQQAAKLCV